MSSTFALVAQLVEHELPKVGLVGTNRKRSTPPHKAGTRSRGERTMGTKKRDDAAENLRGAMRAAMKAGAEVGYDRAVKLVQRIEEAWGEDKATLYSAELRKMRDAIVADMHASIEKETA